MENVQPTTSKVHTPAPSPRRRRPLAILPFAPCPPGSDAKDPILYVTPFGPRQRLPVGATLELRSLSQWVHWRTVRRVLGDPFTPLPPFQLRGPDGEGKTPAGRRPRAFADPCAVEQPRRMHVINSVVGPGCSGRSRLRGM